ncbi:glutamate racemase [Aquicella lusitana]|uniref:Glutamate racemase n=1 Tax=Aquicella lusitana TaxID=254246 RepID=A0A370GY55_9COXI|nr:glutamate racemase [Aquicella lusitana]RDI48582.1 glutamate racemase [Aquicella lusitana]VVC74041.1 Glutamate racemase 1 [Aquicella lusitana]
MKTKHTSSQPIGIFDSGIGGLTVAHALVTHLPKENIIYFGDTAHLPYGDKSTAAIQAYAIKIVNMLLQQECKLILIACHSASAAAYELVKEYIGSKALVMNVIDPVIHLLKEKYITKHVGLIGTRQTVNSHIYKKKIDDLNLGIRLSSSATNLLASAIEEFGNHRVIDVLLETYLAQPNLQNIDALLLACTHYPIIKERISQHYQKQNDGHIELIDSSDIVAQAVKKQLHKNNLLNENGTSAKHFYVSDYTESFANNAKLFFGEDIKLEHYPLWD